MLDLEAFLSVLTSRFKLPYYKEQFVMGFDPTAEDFRARLEELVEEKIYDDTLVEKILNWYKINHPTWFSWMDIVD